MSHLINKTKVAALSDSFRHLLTSELPSLIAFSMISSYRKRKRSQPTHDERTSTIKPKYRPALLDILWLINSIRLRVLSTLAQAARVHSSKTHSSLLSIYKRSASQLANFTMQTMPDLSAIALFQMMLISLLRLFSRTLVSSRKMKHDMLSTPKFWQTHTHQDLKCLVFLNQEHQERIWTEEANT